MLEKHEKGLSKYRDNILVVRNLHIICSNMFHSQYDPAATR